MCTFEANKTFEQWSSNCGCIFRAFFGKQPGFIIAHAGEEYLNIELRTIDERKKYETKLLMRRKLLEHYDDKRPREILKQISHTRKIEDFLFYYIVLYLFILLCIVYHSKRFISFWYVFSWEGFFLQKLFEL